MPEYVQPKLGGTFMWDGREGLTREKYEDFANSLNNIFDHTDQHFFLAFDTSFDRILKTFTALFQREIGGNFKIKDLRI